MAGLVPPTHVSVENSGWRKKGVDGGAKPGQGVGNGPCVSVGRDRVAAAHGVAPATAAPVVLAFGDSLTAGYGLPQNDAFPAQLEARLAELGVKARVVNAGLSGDTTSSALSRLDWALAEKPDLVILEEGFNDALRHLPASLVRANLEAMIKRIKASGARVLLAGALSPRNWGEHYAAEFDRVYPALARADHLPFYPFFLDGVALNPRLNQEDGLHPNREGVAVLVDRIAPYVVRILKGEK